MKLTKANLARVLRAAGHEPVDYTQSLGGTPGFRVEELYIGGMSPGVYLPPFRVRWNGDWSEKRRRLDGYVAALAEHWDATADGKWAEGLYVEVRPRDARVVGGAVEVRERDAKTP